MLRRTTNRTIVAASRKLRNKVSFGIAFLLALQLLFLATVVKMHHHHDDFLNHSDCAICAVGDQKAASSTPPALSLGSIHFEDVFFIEPEAHVQGILLIRSARGPPELG